MKLQQKSSEIQNNSAGKTEHSNNLKPFITSDKIQSRVKELADCISRDYAGKVPIFIGVLNGSFIFISDLVREVSIDVEIDFDRMNEIVNNDTKIAQYENDFRFLARMADEWRCAFKIGMTKAKTQCAVFCEPSKLSTKQFTKKTMIIEKLVQSSGLNRLRDSV